MGFQSPQEVKISCHGGLHKLYVSKLWVYTEEVAHESHLGMCIYMGIQGRRISDPESFLEYSSMLY